MASDHGGDVLAVMSAASSGQHPRLLAEQAPCLVAVVTVDDSSFTTKIKLHSGLVAAQFGFVTLLDTGSPQTFVNTHALESMKRAGAVSAICERHAPPRSRGGRQVPASTDLRCSALKRAILPQRLTDRSTHRVGIRRPIGSYATRRTTRTRQPDAVP